MKGLAGSDNYVPNLAKRASALERQVAKFIAHEMETNVDTSWVRTRTPEEVTKKLKERRVNTTKPIDNFLTLGECLPIIIREDNWRDVFNSIFGKRFRGKDGFKVKFEELISIRNTAVHRPTDLTQRDNQLFDLYEEDLKNCMKGHKKIKFEINASPPEENRAENQNQ